MLCKNCHREIGNRNSCNLCGYDPQKDDNNQNYVADTKLSYIQPPPIEIYRLKSKNGLAAAGFVFGILSFIPIYTWPFALIFGTIGLAKSKSRRNGRVRAIIGLLLCFIWMFIWGIILWLITGGAN